MPFTPEQFLEIRPYLFHLTARENLGRLRATWSLNTAGFLLGAGGQSQWTSRKRNTSIRVRTDGHTVSIRDQAPLYPGNIAFADGWTFEDVIRDLNRRVFFWPGKRDGLPVEYGVRHFQKYVKEAPAVLRFRSEELFALTGFAEARFCQFNSGGPRCSGGQRSPRGPQTFVAAHDAPFNAGDVAEVTFAQSVRLPVAAEVGDSISGPWSPLCQCAESAAGLGDPSVTS